MGSFGRVRIFSGFYLKKVLSFVIIFQIAFSPLALADDRNNSRFSPFAPVVNEQQGQLFDNLVGRSNDYNPLDYFSLLRQDFHPEARSDIKSISPSSALFKVFDERYRVTKQFAASESLYNNFNGLISGETTKFQILLQGRLVHDFRIPIEAIGVLGNYIVFIEKNSFNRSESFRHISFIDLDYFRLAKNELPIFRVPVQGVETLESFRIHKGILYINEKPYERGLFDFSANMNRVLFNVASNVTTAGGIARVLDSLYPFLEAFNANLIEAGKQQSEDLRASLEFSYNKQLEQLERMKAASTEMNAEGLNSLAETFEKPLQEAMGKVHANLLKERSLIGRLGLVWQELTMPRPAEVGRLKEKIVTVAVAARYKQLTASNLIELSREIATNSRVRFSVGTVAAMAMAFYYPEETTRAILYSLDMVTDLGHAAFGKAADLTDLAVNTVRSTLAGLNPFNLYETYIADGAWKRTSVGVTAMFSILTLIMGIPHVILNSYYLIKDFKNSPSLQWRSEDGKLQAREFIRRIVPNFIKRQQELQRDYIVAISDERKSPTSPNSITQEELTRQAREFLMEMERLESEARRRFEFTRASKIWGAIGLFTETHLPSVVSAGNWVNGQWKKFKNIESFVGALRHFIFSYAAFTKSGIFYASAWNFFYMFRLLLLAPKMALTFIFYPNFFKRAVATELGRVTPPSFWNGGTRWVWQEISVQLSRISNSEKYKALREFESSVIPVEKEIGAEALKYSLKALTKYLDQTSDTLVSLSEKGKIAKKLSASDIGSLSYDARTFFASYYDMVIENAMRKYLAIQMMTHTTEAPGVTSQQIKSWFVENNQEVIPGLLDPQELVKREATEEIYQKAYDRVHSSSEFFAKIGVENKHSTIRAMDSETNGRIRRYVIAEQQMKKPSAMARAVRANIAALLVDKPMELLLLFILTAGIKDGPNKPLFEVMFSSDSAFYLSRNVFMAYLSGVIVSIMADIWVKIQQDTRVDRLGGFDQVPTGDHAKRGFLSWYRYQFTHNKNNRWFDHHKYGAEIIFHNMGPAFVLMGITGMATLGRLDLDFYFLGYMTAFFLPFTGLSMKIEQTFEIASGWVLRNVPEHLRSHPLIVEWANNRITKLRLGFQIYYKLYENVLGQFISNLMAITTVKNGTRALSRILFGGKTITEHLIEKTTAATGVIPGARMVDAVCRSLFAGNYSSGPLPPRPSK